MNDIEYVELKKKRRELSDKIDNTPIAERKKIVKELEKIQDEIESASLSLEQRFATIGE